MQVVVHRKKAFSLIVQHNELHCMVNLHVHSIQNLNLLTNVRIYFFHLINPKNVCNVCNVHVCIHVFMCILQLVHV